MTFVMHFFIFREVRVLHITCRNIYCVYCEDGECLIDEISHNESGVCEECININVGEDYIKKERHRLLRMYDECDGTDIAKNLK